MALAKEVQPEEEAFFKFEITAPQIPGTYDFHWQMKDGDGVAFGPGTEHKMLEVVELVLGSQDPKKQLPHIFPNPVSTGLVTVALGHALTSAVAIRVYAMSGASLLQTTVMPSGQSTIEVDLHGIGAGLYLFELSGAGTVYPPKACGQLRGSIGLAYSQAGAMSVVCQRQGNEAKITACFGIGSPS